MCQICGVDIKRDHCRPQEWEEAQHLNLSEYLVRCHKIPHYFDIDNHSYNQNPGLTLNPIAFFIKLVPREPHMGNSVPDFGSSVVDVAFTPDNLVSVTGWLHRTRIL
jgi:hypothetical protein